MIEDKIINHLVARYFLIDIFDKALIEENCATRVGKGTHYALNLFKSYYNNYKNKYNKFYILKFDISKYFYNIDHDIVKELISNKIKDKKVLNLLFKIIDSTDENYVNKKVLELKVKEINRINKLNISDKEKISFLGFRFFIKNNKTIIKISNKTKKNFKKKIKTKNINIISSYIGHLKHGSCNNLIYKGVHNEKI